MIRRRRLDPKALLLLAAVCGCAGRTPPSSAPSVDDALVDALASHGCAFLADHFLVLPDAAGASSGRIWVQGCEAVRDPHSARLSATILGWQWIDTRVAGFDVREYVYFRARVGASVRGHLRVDRGRPVVSFVAQDRDVRVEEVGRVSARPATLGSRLVGAAAAVFGTGPNSVATSAMRGEVASVLGARLARGADWSLDEMKGASSLLEDDQALHPGGALLSGPLRAGDAVTVHYDVEMDGDVLLRAVCLSEVKDAVASIIDGSATSSIAPPLDTRHVRGHGTLELASMPCPWVLVTGAAEKHDARVHLKLDVTQSKAHCDLHRCLVRVLLETFEVAPRRADGRAWDPDDGAPDVAFVLETSAPGTATAFGPVFPDTVSATPWLSSSPIELAGGETLRLRADDIDPLPPKLLQADRWTRETIGTAALRPAEIVPGAELRLPLLFGAAEQGAVRVRIEVVDEP